MSPEDNQENSPDTGEADPNSAEGRSAAVDSSQIGYEVGRRSITTRGAITRRQMVADKHRLQMKSRPFILAAAIVLIGILTIPVYAYFQVFVLPPRELALRVAGTEYTRGDVVNFIRFNQRMSEDLGIPFEIGNSLFDALQTLEENELSYQLAPKYRISVSPEEVDARVDFMLGFVAATPAERESGEYQSNIEEARRQFMHRIEMEESEFRDFIRKSMFKERLRLEIAKRIDRVQPQVHLYEITRYERDPETRRTIERDLTSGDPIEEVVLRYSDDPQVRRTRGDRGWVPLGVLPEIDAFLFGTDDDGNRLFPIRVPSVGQYDNEDDLWRYLVIDEVNEAREIDEEHMEVLATREMEIFLTSERANFELYMVLDSDIFSWINKQVALSTLLPTPTPVPFDAQFGGLSQLGP